MMAAVDAMRAGVDLNSGGFMRDEDPDTGYAYEWLHRVETHSISARTHACTHARTHAHRHTINTR